ncbi:MAG: hypothetical protein DMG06_23570 [Acidobacteria bacterium]|nr:MAG: hypothetical protein DMG06_23570 [Acidobacteriota bacterium]
MKKLKIGGDWKGEAPAEPHGAKDLLGRWLARRLALPIFSQLPSPWVRGRPFVRNLVSGGGLN